MRIVAAKKILRANDQLAAENRAALDAEGVFCVNMVGSPGCGKTTLLEALFALLKDRLAPAVIEGDIAGSTRWACRWSRSTPRGRATSTRT